MVKVLLLLLLNLQGEPGQIFTYGFGARAFGMGGAYSAQYKDLNSMYYNPANIALLDQNTFSIGYTDLGEDLSLIYASVGRISHKGISYGFHSIYFNTPGFEGRDENNRPQGEYDFLEIAGGGIIGKKFMEHLYAGLSLKLYYGRIRSYTASGLGADIGITSTFIPGFATSLVLRNIIPMSIRYYKEKEKAPLGLRMGISASPTPEFNLSVDLDYSSYSGFKGFFGGEGRLLNMLYLRGGYDGSYISAGIGIEKPLGDKNIKIDYTYSMSLSQLVFQDIHHVTLTYSYGGFRVYAEVDRKYLDISESGGLAWILIHARTRGDVKSWKLLILTKDGEKVKEFGGRGTPPLRIAWDGRDETGRIVVEGKYYYELVVEDEDGNFYTKKGKLVEVRVAL